MRFAGVRCVCVCVCACQLAKQGEARQGKARQGRQRNNNTDNRAQYDDIPLILAATAGK